MLTDTGTSPSPELDVNEVGAILQDIRCIPSDFPNPTARVLFSAGNYKMACRCQDCGKWFRFEDCGQHQTKRTWRCGSRFLCENCAGVAATTLVKRYTRMESQIGQFTYGEISKPCEPTQSAIRRVLDTLSRALRGSHAYILFVPRWHQGSLRVRYLHSGPVEPTAAIRRRFLDAKITAGLYLPHHLHEFLPRLFAPEIASSPTARVEQYEMFKGIRQLRTGGDQLASYLYTEKTNTANSLLADDDPDDRRPKCPVCRRRILRRTQDIHVSDLTITREQLNWTPLRR